MNYLNEEVIRMMIKGANKTRNENDLLVLIDIYLFIQSIKQPFPLSFFLLIEM